MYCACAWSRLINKRVWAGWLRAHHVCCLRSVSQWCCMCTCQHGRATQRELHESGLPYARACLRRARLPPAGCGWLAVLLYAASQSLV